MVERSRETYRYRCVSGDPLGLGGDVEGSADETFDATREGSYPDAIVQILSLAGSSRAGDIILSATPGWDFRARYEPIPHQSSHGALHRDHMMVPLLLNRPRRAPLAERRISSPARSTRSESRRRHRSTAARSSAARDGSVGRREHSER